jgi:hypothetical protein
VGHRNWTIVTGGTMKNAVFWDIKPQFVLHRRHVTSPLQSSDVQCYIRFEVFTAVTMKNTIFWDVTPCGSCNIWRFERLTSIVRVKRICELGTTLAVTSKWNAPKRNTCHPDDGGNNFLRNVGSHKNLTAWHPRIRHSSNSNIFYQETYVL